MIQRFIHIIKSLKHQFVYADSSMEENILDVLPDTLEIRDYLDTIPDSEELDLL